MKTSILTLILAASAVSYTYAASCCGGCSTDATAKSTKAMKADIVGTAVAAGQFNTLVAAVQAAGLVDVLKGEGPFTVFAPTDAAFAKLPAGTVESLLLPENKDKLISILTYHVVPAKVMSGDVKAGEAPTVNGQTATITIENGNVMIEGAKVIAVDVPASNGVIHVIDTVILPDDKKKS